MPDDPGATATKNKPATENAPAGGWQKAFAHLFRTVGVKGLTQPFGDRPNLTLVDK